MTVRAAAPDKPDTVAVTVVVPTAIALAFPFEPAALLMIAFDVSEELQVTIAVKSWVELFESVPVAMNCWLVPAAMLELAGVTAIDTSVIELPPPSPQPASIKLMNSTRYITGLE